MSAVRIQIGAGDKYWPGFVNVDAHGEQDIKADCSKRLPFDADYADEIHSIHFVEHIGRLEVNNMLMDWHRVLKPGGKVCIEVPCLNKIAQFIVNGEKNMRMTVLGIFGDPRDKKLGMMHQWAYTREEMTELLLQCGFKDVRVIDPHFHHVPRDMRVEATKQ